jgi:hypothetical protein
MKPKNKIRKIDLAPDKQITSIIKEYPAIYERFVKCILKQKPKNVLLTDESSLWDFVPALQANELFSEQILAEYKIDISRMKKLLIWKILEKACRKHSHISMILHFYPQLTQEYLDTGTISDKSIISIGPMLFKNDQEVDRLLASIGER